MKRLAKDRLVTVFRRVTLTLILFVKVVNFAVLSLPRD